VADTIRDAVLRLPVKQLCGPVGPGVCAGHVAWAPLGVSRLDRRVGYAIECVEQFPHGGAIAGAQVDDAVTARRCQQLIESAQRRDVSGRQVPDMNVVPDTRSVPGRVIRASDLERDARFQSLHHLAESMGGLGQLQAGAHLGVRADRIEVPQGEHADGLRGGDVGEHRLTRCFRPPVRTLRVDRGVLVHRQVGTGPVDGGR